MPLSPGHKFGPYTLLDRLGSGGMWKGGREESWRVPALAGGVSPALTELQRIGEELLAL